MEFQKNLFCILFCWNPSDLVSLETSFNSVINDKGVERKSENSPKTMKTGKGTKIRKVPWSYPFPCFYLHKCSFPSVLFQKTTFLREKLSFYTRKLSRISESCSNSSCIGSIWANMIFRLLPVFSTSEFEVRYQNFTIFK